METHVPVDEDICIKRAREVFGIPYLFPWQRLVIANILDAIASKNAPMDEEEQFDEDGVLRGQQIVLLPTGAGKSLCFQLPAVLLEGQTLVIYPLLALMGDQERRLREAGVETVIFRGEQDANTRQDCLDRLEGKNGRSAAQLIIANPEVLAGEKLLDRIARRNIAHIAIDEAHCVSEWGDSFRPAYLGLGDIIKRINAPAVTAFTATASPGVLTRVAEVLFDGRAHLVRGESDRANLVYRVRPCRSKEIALVDEVRKASWPLVVFCSSRGGCEKTALLLREALCCEDIKFYHAGLSKEEKINVETWFHTHPKAILCTTCAWGMGVDKKDVKTVIHRDVPPTAEAYIQEAGRGGRDGTVAQAILLWSDLDGRRIARLGEKERLRARELVRFAQGKRCRRLVLLEALGDPRASGQGPEGEGIACSGCDVCDGKAEVLPTEDRLVLDFTRLHPRSYSQNDMAEILYAGANAHERMRGWQYSWRVSDVHASITALLEAGTLQKSRYWPQKGRLYLSAAFSLPAGPHLLRRQGRPAHLRLPGLHSFFRRRQQGPSCGRDVAGVFGSEQSS